VTVENDPLRCHDRLVPDVRWSFCRLCNKACPILCEIEDGRLVRVTGDRADARYSGYTCTKGRAPPELLYGPQHLLHSLKRDADGTLQPVPVEQAMDEIAARLGQILDEHAPGRSRRTTAPSSRTCRPNR
jgi:anaerobic selenocysteine-containing dehydrogenase